jgi:biotin transporter BioY
MYIIAIGWLYVAILMAFTETSILAGVMTFLFYGLFPVALLLWLLGTPLRRKRRRAAEEAAAEVEPQAAERSPVTGREGSV